MRSGLSRRDALMLLGGGVASLSLAWGLSKSSLWHRTTSIPPAAADLLVDYSGWLLTAADKDKLTATGHIKLLDGTMFDGHDIADKVVPDAAACSAWCVTEPDCQSFTYGKHEHPDPDKRDRCWLKNTSKATPVLDRQFISGIR